MNSMSPHDLGREGERLALDYLCSLKGWKVLERNVRLKQGELDIVAFDEPENELVVVEVRTRRIGAMSPAETTVGPLKLGKLIRFGRMYVERARYEGYWRIDVIAVTQDAQGQYEIEHYRNAEQSMPR